MSQPCAIDILFLFFHWRMPFWGIFMPPDHSSRLWHLMDTGWAEHQLEWDKGPGLTVPVSQDKIHPESISLVLWGAVLRQDVDGSPRPHSSPGWSDLDFSAPACSRHQTPELMAGLSWTCLAGGWQLSHYRLWKLHVSTRKYMQMYKSMKENKDYL